MTLVGSMKLNVPFGKRRLDGTAPPVDGRLPRFLGSRVANCFAIMLADHSEMQTATVVQWCGIGPKLCLQANADRILARCARMQVTSQSADALHPVCVVVGQKLDFENIRYAIPFVGRVLEDIAASYDGQARWYDDRDALEDRLGY